MSNESCFTTDTVVQREVRSIRSISIGLSCSGLSFFGHCNRQFTYAVFYIQNRNLCLSKKILYQYFDAFCPAWDSFSSENILHVTT